MLLFCAFEFQLCCGPTLSLFSSVDGLPSSFPIGRLKGWGFRERGCGYSCWLSQVQVPSSLTQREKVPDKPGGVHQGSLCLRKTSGPADCPPRPCHIHGAEQRDHRSCSLNGPKSTWRRIPHLKVCLHPSPLYWPHYLALSRHSNSTGAAAPWALRAGQSSWVIQLSPGY